MEPWHYGALKQLYAAAPINRFYAPRLEIGHETATIEMDARPEFHHAAHAMHGSVYFKALDDACFFAANSVVPDVFVLTVHYALDLEAPVTRGTLRADARVTKRGNRSIHAEGELFVDGARVARGRGVFVPSAHKLDELLAALAQRAP